MIKKVSQRYTVTLWEGPDVRDVIYTDKIAQAQKRWSEFAGRIQDGTSATLADNSLAGHNIIAAAEWSDMRRALSQPATPVCTCDERRSGRHADWCPACPTEQWIANID